MNLFLQRLQWRKILEAVLSVLFRIFLDLKSADYAQLVDNLIWRYETLGCRMSIKLHFLHSHLGYFPRNISIYSEEQSERFHQDICQMESRYQGRRNISMMADYCWSLKRANPSVEHNKQYRKLQFK